MTNTNDAGTKRRAFLSDPAKARPNEVIGGGFFVFSRQPDTHRIHPAKYPFEHPDRGAAETEAGKLAEQFPNREFIIVQQVGGVIRKEVSNG